MTPPPPARPAGPATLNLIRFAILLAVLTFGGVTWFVHRQPGWTPDPSMDPAVLRSVGYALWGTALIAVAFLRLRWDREQSPARRAPLRVVGWALGEAPALWGGVYYFVTDDAGWYALGVTFLILTFLLFPIPRKP